VPRRVPLSLLVDQAAGDGPRDQSFVRGFSAWLLAHAPRVSLPVVEGLGLTNVVVTFKMKDRVRLIVTGCPPEPFPGDVTLAIDEADFPGVDLELLEAPRDVPYEFCTLDYAFSGRPMTITEGPRAGQTGRLVVSATIGAREEHRVVLDSGEALTVGPGVFTFLP
jgi:hypothetical protein